MTRWARLKKSNGARFYCLSLDNIHISFTFVERVPPATVGSPSHCRVRFVFVNLGAFLFSFCIFDNHVRFCLIISVAFMSPNPWSKSILKKTKAFFWIKICATNQNFTCMLPLVYMRHCLVPIISITKVIYLFRFCFLPFIFSFFGEFFFEVEAAWTPSYLSHEKCYQHEVLPCVVLD